MLSARDGDGVEVSDPTKVDKRVVDELLLVCGVIGSRVAPSAAGDPSSSSSADPPPSAATSASEFVPVSDCLAWLQDLQRALRRDDDACRPIALLLGQWNVVSQKLLPLALGCRYDRPLVLTICKILVILTKPPSGRARRAGRMVVDVRSGKVDERVVREQIRLRDNAIAQSDLLMEYKRLFVRHPSHRRVFQDGDGDSEGAKEVGGGTGLLSVFTSLLAEPLSKTGTSRTPSDHLTIELVLHLFRNLSCIEPLGTFGDAEVSRRSAALHRDLVCLLEREMALDVFLVLGQEVESRENRGYNLLLMEILHHLLRGQDPSDVAAAGATTAPRSASAAAATIAVTPARGKTATASIAGKKRRIATTAAATGGRRSGGGGDSLRSHLRAERQKMDITAPSRHSHFGGTLVTKSNLGSGGGKRRYVSSSDFLCRTLAGSSSSSSVAGAGEPARRKNRKAEPFVGSGRSASVHRAGGGTSAAGPAKAATAPEALRANRALHRFCAGFAARCYGPVMKSLKNEFRRDSSRLEDGDRIMFFRIVWFFHQWWRMGGKGSRVGGIGERPESSAENLIFTMDVFTFNLVLTSADEFHERKKHAALAQAVALYGEMVHLLRSMHGSADSTERVMALGLMDRLFYAPEPLDRTSRLLSRWKPGMFGREYLCDLVETAHAVWKLLDANAERVAREAADDGDGDKSRGSSGDAVARMDAAAADFDAEAHFLRKFVSNHIAFAYTQLLSQYRINAVHVNRHVAAYFLRLCKFPISKATDGDDGGFDDALGENALAAKTATLEPMLYNLPLMSILDEILHDPSLRDDDENSSLLLFAASFVRRFARAAEANPMLYVECLFRHPLPQRFCELSSNIYVTEELRMIALREILLEDQRKYELAASVRNDDGGDDNDEEEGAEATSDVDGKVRRDRNERDGREEEEEELEFDEEDLGNDATLPEGKKKKKRRRKRQKKRRRIGGTSDDESSDDGGGDEEGDVEFDAAVASNNRGKPARNDDGGINDDDEEEEADRDVDGRVRGDRNERDGGEGEDEEEGELGFNEEDVENDATLPQGRKKKKKRRKKKQKTKRRISRTSDDESSDGGGGDEEEDAESVASNDRYNPRREEDEEPTTESREEGGSGSEPVSDPELANGATDNRRGSAEGSDGELPREREEDAGGSADTPAGTPSPSSDEIEDDGGRERSGASTKKKRIRSSQIAADDEDSDDEDFSSGPYSKSSQRVIFDDDDDDE